MIQCTSRNFIIPYIQWLRPAFLRNNPTESVSLLDFYYTNPFDLFLMAGTGECKAVILEISTARGQIENLSTGPRGQSYAR